MRNLHSAILYLLFLFFMSSSFLKAGIATSNVTLIDGVNPSAAGIATQELQSGVHNIILTAGVSGTLTNLEIKTNGLRVKFKISNINSTCGDSSNGIFDPFNNASFQTFLSSIPMNANDTICIEFDKYDTKGRGYVRATFNVPTPNTPPVAEAGLDQTVATTSLVTLDGSGSSDAEGDPLTYAWVLTGTPAGSVATLVGATTVNPTFTADLNGTYVVSLTVNDGTVDSTADTVTITSKTNEAPPVFSGTIPNQTGPSDSYFSMNISTYFTQTDNDAITYSVSNNLPAGLNLNTTTGIISGTPTSIGAFNTIVVTATDNDGSTNSNAFTITITSNGIDTSLFGEVYCGPLNTLKGGPGIEFGGNITVEGSGGPELETPGLVSGANGSTCDGSTCAASGGGVDPISFTVGLLGGTGVALTHTGTDITLKNATNSLSDEIVYASGIIDADNTLYVDGHVEIHVDGGAVFKFKEIIFKDPQATLQLFANGLVELTSDLVVKGDGFTSSPLQLQILTKGDLKTGSGNTNGVIRALIYAAGTVTYEGATSSRTGPDFYGSITANKIISGSSGYITAAYNEGCDAGVNYDVPFFVDAVDTAYTDAAYTDTNGPDIQTKVSFRSGYNFDAVYLGQDNTGAETYIDLGNHGIALTVQMSLANSDCSEEIYWDQSRGGEPVGVAEILPGNVSASLNETVDMPAVVGQDMRLLLKAVDWNILWEKFKISNACNNSSLTGSLCGVMSCLSSLTQAKTAFPINTPDANVNANSRRIMTNCYGVGINDQGTAVETDDTVIGAISATSACKTNNYSGNCGGDKSNIDPDKYQHKYGCLSCILDTDLEGRGCSVDHFAVRPDHFILSMNDPDFPNLLRAGEGYGVALTAYDDNDVVSGDFNVTNFNSNLDTNVTRYFRDGTEDVSDLLHGTSDLNTSTVAYSVGGYSRETNTTGSAEAIVEATYDDIGKLNLLIYDKIWAAIDDDDTPTDCNSTTHTYICGDANVTFIPHHFNVENIHLRNHNDGNYTYLSNDLSMSAHIDANISARNADGNITRNFMQGSLYYENPVSVDLNITEWLGLASRHPKGNNTHKHDIPTEILLGFGGADANGTHNIPWNESNATQQLIFNYDRENDQTVNPFIVNGTDINVSVQSTYTDDSTPSSPAIISGSGIGNRNATFYFGRVKSSQFFYDNVTTSVQTPISVVVYCDTWPTCPELNNEIKINEPYWWLAVEHDEATGDGNITLISPPTVTIGAGNPTITPDVDVTVIPTQPGVDTDVYVNSGATTSLPMTVEIFLDTTPTTDTNSWLIYYTESDILDPDPFYRVRFIGQSGWTGHGKTGHVVDSNASKEINKRLSW